MKTVTLLIFVYSSAPQYGVPHNDKIIDVEAQQYTSVEICERIAETARKNNKRLTDTNKYLNITTQCVLHEE